MITELMGFTFDGPPDDAWLTEVRYRSPMVWVLVTAGVLMASLVTMARELRQNVTLRQIRPTALELSGEVIDNSATSSGKPGAYFLTPVVRYYIDGKRYEAEIVNATFGRPADVGSSMTVLVSPESPYSPMDPYGGLGATLRGAISTGVLSTLLLVWQLVLM
ncbi:DUF3592 domain-containing protein [Streptomyces sp. HUAS TT20]|uniref:DUF3592 domain-containing protein n=1 Tax=Streptomyces sp. HUAS TT20 TaxID=3447509 RepID=UPI0021D8D893|nr:DUF3592 domain-containing protein [Streptomyces sp. HUAS 15-9]UXY28158.1 DUF3592 domain-containing protein [Streptomyces sp. HUAS 15-9]